MVKNLAHPRSHPVLYVDYTIGQKPRHFVNGRVREKSLSLRMLEQPVGTLSSMPSIAGIARRKG